MPSSGNRKHDIIEALYICPDVNAAIKKMEPVELQEDLKSEMFMVLFMMDEERLIDMHEKGYLKFFLVRTMLNMIKSDRSTFWNNYRNLSEMKAYDVADTIEVEEIKIDLGEVFGTSNHGLYERDMFLLYANEFDKNAKELSRATKIPYQTVVRTLKIAKDKLKAHIKCKQS